MKLQPKLDDLRDFIKKYNTYFNDGYSDVTQDGSVGIISNGRELIFPADDKGKYFYLRLPNNLLADYTIPAIADNAQSIGVRYDVILVACIEGADPVLLLENLITTIGKYNKEQLKITKMICQKEVILMQELAKIKDKENIDAALQKLSDDMALACVHFTFTIPFVFQNLNCLQDPCKNC